jgi:hypothetical protein
MNIENIVVKALYPIHYHGAVGMYDTLTGRVTMVDSEDFNTIDKTLLKEYGEDFEQLGLC